MQDSIPHTTPPLKKGVIALICMIYGAIGLSTLGWMTLRVEDYAEPVAVVFPPGFKAADSFRHVVNAKGAPIRYGGSGNIIIAQFDSQSAQDIKNKTNALFLMNPIAAGACFMNVKEIHHDL